MNFDTLLRGKELWTTMELVKQGLFKHRGSVWGLVKKGKLESIMVSQRARVITRTSIINYLKALNKK